MTNDSLQDRGKAMEDMFFHDRDAQLIEKMKAELSAEEDRTSLIAATGIQDASVINKLMEQGISCETLAGVGLIPLVVVAWADGKMEDKEREAILQAACESGINKEHGSYQLVSSWLEKKPADGLFNSWKDYVAALKQNLDEASVNQIKRSVIDRAQRVADSAGGFLGIAETSGVEKKPIEELEAAFG